VNDPVQRRHICPCAVSESISVPESQKNPPLDTHSFASHLISISLLDKIQKLSSFLSKFTIVTTINPSFEHNSQNHQRHCIPQDQQIRATFNISIAKFEDENVRSTYDKTYCKNIYCSLYYVHCGVECCISPCSIQDGETKNIDDCMGKRATIRYAN
jgi:hypothetical protein